MEATLEAVRRTGKGKNEARRLRASGKVPAVVYGAQKAGDAVAPVAVGVDPKQMLRILRSGSGVNTLITLNVAGESTQKVLVREFQLDPVTQKQLDRGYRMVEILKQGQYQPLHVVDQVMAIYAANQGGLDNVPRNKVRTWEAQFLNFMKEQHPEVRELIGKTREITPEVEKQLNASIEFFNKQFKA